MTEHIKFLNSKYSYVKSRYLEIRHDFSANPEMQKSRKSNLQKRGNSVMTESFEFHRPKKLQESSVSVCQTLTSQLLYFY